MSIEPVRIIESPEIRRIFDDTVLGIPVELLEKIKYFVENNISRIIGVDGKLEIRIVVDANTVISQTINYIKRNDQPLIVKLSKSPFVKVYAPTKILKETLEDELKLSKIAIKKNIELEELKEKLSEVLSCIEIIDPEGDREFKKAQQLIGSRDPDDVDYLQLYFSINAICIVTNDSDFEGLLGVQTWKNMGSIKKLTVDATVGSISFALIATSGTAIADFLSKIITAVLGIILDTLSIIEKNIERLIKWAIYSFSRLSGELKIVVIAILIISWYTFRKEIDNTIKQIKLFIEKVIEFLHQVIEFISYMLQVNSRSCGEIARVIGSLSMYSVKLIRLYKQINCE